MQSVSKIQLKRLPLLPPQNAPKQACALPLRSRTLDLFSHLCHKWESSTCFAELGPEAPSHCSSSALYLQSLMASWLLNIFKKTFFPQWPYFSCCRVGGLCIFRTYLCMCSHCHVLKANFLMKRCLCACVRCFKKLAQQPTCL